MQQLLASIFLYHIGKIGIAYLMRNTEWGTREADYFDLSHSIQESHSNS